MGIRNFRAEMKLSPKVGIELKMDKKNKNFKILNTYKLYLEQLCGVQSIAHATNPPPSSIILVPGDKIFIPLKGLIDPEVEISRNSENLNKLNKNLVLLQDQLGNKKFLNNAPKMLIKERKIQLKEIKTKISETKNHLKVLKKV